MSKEAADTTRRYIVHQKMTHARGNPALAAPDISAKPTPLCPGQLILGPPSKLQRRCLHTGSLLLPPPFPESVAGFVALSKGLGNVTRPALFTHTDAHMHTHNHACTHIHTTMHTHTCMHTHTHSHACTHMHAHTQSCMPTHNHACTHTIMHTHTHTLACTHMHAQT